MTMTTCRSLGREEVGYTRVTAPCAHAHACIALTHTWFQGVNFIVAILLLVFNAEVLLIITMLVANARRQCSSLMLVANPRR